MLVYGVTLFTMAGRPRAPVVIVDNVLPAAALSELDISHRELVHLSLDPLMTIRWLARYGLIRNSMRCTDCDIDMSLQVRAGARFVDGYAWSCRGCRAQKSLRIGSFFKGSHLTFIQLLDIVYYWAKQMKQSEVCDETGICRRVVVDWHNFLRDICCQYLLNHPVQMGGPGRVVEIDE